MAGINPEDARARLAAAVDAARAIAATGDRTAGRQHLIAHAGPRLADRGKAPTVADQHLVKARVFVGDGFRCGYCRRPVIPECVIYALGEAIADDALFPVRRTSWAGCHPMLNEHASTVDHRICWSRFTGSRDQYWARTNLVTSCWPCNSRKADLAADDVLGLGLAEIWDVGDDWDGLTGIYEDLVNLTPSASADPYHRDWLRAFQRARAELADGEVRGEA